MVHYDNSFHTLEISCDGASCGTSRVFEGEFEGAIKEAKAEGWVIKGVDDGRGNTDFYHYCSRDCKDS